MIMCVSFSNSVEITFAGKDSLNKFINIEEIYIMLKGKRITTLNLDSDLVDKAQQYGLSLSKWVNAKLYEFFYGASNTHESPNGSSPSTDLIVHMSNDFRTWLKANRADKKYIASLESYLTKYFTGLVLNTPQNIVEYLSRMKTTSKYPILALRVYIKYLEETDQIKMEHSQHLKKVLKVKKSKPDTYVPTDDKVKEAYHKLNEDRDRLIFEILAYSGVRVTEMVKMLKEFEPNNLVRNEKFARYSLNYSRGQKRSYYIYMPLEISNKVKRFYKIGNKEITKIIGIRSGLSPKYLRKWFFNKSIMSGVPESVADFYEGRSPATVGSANYMDKTRQADHYYEKIVGILKEAIQ